MPDIGSSQNLQTAQENPQLNGNAGQNGEKYPDHEVRDIWNLWLIISLVLICSLAKVVEIFQSMPITTGDYQIQKTNLSMKLVT